MANDIENNNGEIIIYQSEDGKKRTTPEFITELQPGEIFVFGSNLSGMHGGV